MVWKSDTAFIRDQKQFKLMVLVLILMNDKDRCRECDNIYVCDILREKYHPEHRTKHISSVIFN